jgi:undecaprenyl-diphosphatase
MSLLQALVLGIVQGLTEFLPVSSSGHLILFSSWLGSGNDLGFDLALHIGTLLALLWYFRRDIAQLAAGLLKGKSLSWYMAAATIPAVLAGVLLQDAAETAFRSYALVAFNLIWVAVLMLAVERYAKHKKQLEQLRLPGSIGIGVAQALALIPGVSRSGITITAGLAQGLTYEAATRFSFLLSAPIIAGAIAKVLLSSGAGSVNLPVVGVGVLASFISGYIAIRFMLSFLSKYGLRPFAYYRIALGVLILSLF